MMKSSLKKMLVTIGIVWLALNGLGADAVTPCEEDIPITKEVVEVVEVVSQTDVYNLGVCKISAYCKENYPHICNNGDSSSTSTGTTPTPDRTVAVDPKVIPYGSEVIIDGHTYIAEDCGGAIKGNRIDILFETHQEALEFGIQYREVNYVIKEDK